MSEETRPAGRPRASSRETIADAACELFLERGYEGTSIADITTRAGVSRSSFFNYFAAKGDIFWAAFDARLAAVTADLLRVDSVATGLARLADGLAPDALALGIANAAAMDLVDELERERAVRQLRLGDVVAARLRRDGADTFVAEVRGAAYAAAVFAAVWSWAAAAGREDLHAALRRALAAVG